MIMLRIAIFTAPSDRATLFDDTVTAKNTFPNRMASMMPSGNAGLITRIKIVIAPIRKP